MQLPDRSFLFGRVILAGGPGEPAPLPDGHLVYVYDWRAPSPEPDFARLLRGRLLIPPMWVNRLGWIQGYFRTVAHRELCAFDRLRQHSFWDARARVHRDETGRRRERPCEPCGSWMVVSHRWIDDLISDALEIPRAE